MIDMVGTGISTASQSCHLWRFESPPLCKLISHFTFSINSIMNQPTLTPEKIAQLLAVPFSDSYGWTARRLARARAHYAYLLGQYDDMLAISERGLQEITISGGGMSLTISAEALSTCLPDEVMGHLSKQIKEALSEVLRAVANMQGEDSELAQDLNCEHALARLEVLSLALTPAGFAAWTGIPPTKGKTIPMAAAPSLAAQAA
jgi:hypothetical protein